MMLFKFRNTRSVCFALILINLPTNSAHAAITPTNCDNVNNCAALVGVSIATALALAGAIVYIIKANNPNSNVTADEALSQILSNGQPPLNSAVDQYTATQARLRSSPEYFGESVLSGETFDATAPLSAQFTQYAGIYSDYANNLSQIKQTDLPLLDQQGSISDYFVDSDNLFTIAEFKAWASSSPKAFSGNLITSAVNSKLTDYTFVQEYIPSSYTVFGEEITPDSQSSLVDFLNSWNPGYGLNKLSVLQDINSAVVSPPLSSLQLPSDYKNPFDFLMKAIGSKVNLGDFKIWVSGDVASVLAPGLETQFMQAMLPETSLDLLGFVKSWATILSSTDFASTQAIMNVLNTPLAKGGLADAVLPSTSGMKSGLDYLIVNKVAPGQLADLVNQTRCAFNNGKLPATYTPIDPTVIAKANSMGILPENQLFFNQLVQDNITVNSQDGISVDLPTSISQMKQLLMDNAGLTGQLTYDQLLNYASQASAEAGLAGKVTVKAIDAIVKVSKEYLPGSEPITSFFESEIREAADYISAPASKGSGTSGSSSSSTPSGSKGANNDSPVNGNSNVPSNGDLGNFQEALKSTTYYRNCYNIEGQFSLTTFQSILGTSANQAQIRQDLIEIGKSLEDDQESPQYSDYKSARSAYVEKYGEDAAIPE